MPDLDLNTLGTSILNAMQNVFGASWESVASLAVTEAQKLAGTLINIQLGTADGSVTKSQAAILLDMQEHATRAVLMSVEGIGMLVAEQAIQAGLEAVSKDVDGTLGFALL